MDKTKKMDLFCEDNKKQEKNLDINFFEENIKLKEKIKELNIYRERYLNLYSYFAESYECKEFLKIEDYLYNIETNHNKELCKFKKEIEELKKEIEELKKNQGLVKKQRQISSEKVEEIKNLRKQGLSYREIEVKTKWSKFTINRVLNGFYDL